MDPNDSAEKARRLLKCIYDYTLGQDEPVFVQQLATDADLTSEEAEAAWRYLRDKALIQVYSIPYSARINSRGIDLVETPKVGVLPAGGGVTNNYVSIGTAINSPVQQGGANSSQAHNTHVQGDATPDLGRLIDALRQNLNELNLDERSEKKAKAQLATLEAQLSDEPDPIIVGQAGRTLRNITEGAIGSLVASAVQPSLWSWVGSAMATLFP